MSTNKNGRKDDRKEAPERKTADENDRAGDPEEVPTCEVCGGPRASGKSLERM